VQLQPILQVPTLTIFMKTVKEYLQELPEPARSQALANMWWEDADSIYPNIKIALYQAFNWSKSPQGYQYWKKVHDSI
jgi:hypothetical protein